MEIIHKNGQPYGIGDKGGYLLFFPKVTKYDGQEARYEHEIKELYNLSKKILNILTPKK